MHYMLVAKYMTVRRNRPDIPFWATYAIVRSMAWTPASERWDIRTITFGAEMIARGWSKQAALAYKGIFMQGDPIPMEKK